MGLFKKKEKESEVFYDSKISFDGGLTFCTAEEAMPIIEKLNIWSKVYDSFDPKIFERVRKTSLEYTPLNDKKKYLSYSPNNIVMGKKKTDIWVVGDFRYASLKDSDFGEEYIQHKTYYDDNTIFVLSCGIYPYNVPHIMERSVKVNIGGRGIKYYKKQSLIWNSANVEVEDRLHIESCSNSEFLVEPGEIIEFKGIRIFTFGGGFPIECFKEINTPIELEGSNITEETIKHARENLAKHNWEVDYVATYYAPNNIHLSLAPGFYTPNIITNFFDELQEKLKYKHWYVGAYNMDRDFENSITALYRKPVCINVEQVKSEDPALPTTNNSFSFKEIK